MPVVTLQNKVKNFDKNNQISKKDVFQTLSQLIDSSKWSIIPTVKAARPPEEPQRPPPMRYTNLPIYNSPHSDYKEYIENKNKCPGLETRILHCYFLPIVKSNRKSITQKTCEFYKDFLELKCDFFCAIKRKKDCFIQEMREPKNLYLRQAVVVAGGAAGLYFGRSAIGITKPLFFAALGLLATGALCFPKETDETFRTVTFHTANTALMLYNQYCTKNFQMRPQVPCKEDMPSPPPARSKKNVCNKK